MSNDKAQYRVDITRSNIQGYLLSHGWEVEESNNKDWIVFQGEKGIDGQPITIVLSTIQDEQYYKNNAIDALAAIYDKPTEQITEEIYSFDKDILRIRNLEVDSSGTLSLRVAAQQVEEMKQLVLYAACSEITAEPYHPTAQLAFAQKMVESFTFGHTFPGSFGFKIESQINLGERAVQGAFWDPEEPEFVPSQRRVMERILRGLVVTEQATREHNHAELLESYKLGFNANMCRAIVNMATKRKLDLEYSVSWSPKIPVAPDLSGVGLIRLSDSSYANLDFVAKELKELSPEQVLLRGLVTDLSSKGNPFGTETSREVIVKWTNRTDGPPANVSMHLGKDHYMEALKAHRGWIPIEVSGFLNKSTKPWSLENLKNFNLLDDDPD